MEEVQFRRILEKFGYSWDGYRRVRKGVKKRLARHMQERRCRTGEDYIETINRDGNLLRQCERLMTASISSFIRDRKLRETLVELWSAGCASGEACSCRIVWETFRPSCGHRVDLSILATDRCPAHLGRAKAADYPASSLREVPPSVRSTCF